ncbi:hypothetical protein OSTOST_12835, partial [Ostertagia ostertagi]
GFMSKVLLVNADWQHKEKKLPEKFVLKSTRSTVRENSQETNLLKGYIAMEYLENANQREIFESFTLGEVRQEMEEIISTLRSHDAGKFARNADQLKAIVPDMINFKWADNLGYKF